jgi:hypothetical protein
VTFSDSRIVSMLRHDFVPVWESVAPVSIATFDLGDGRTVRGTVGGEIAVYFCRPDGVVYDILPALHSPHVTYWTMRRALDFYSTTGATDEAIAAHHRQRLHAMELAGKGQPTPGIERARRDIRRRRQDPDAGTRALGEMLDSKSGVPGPEPLTVVEPGGLDFYLRQVHREFTVSPPRRPDEWKETLFVRILDMELTGGEVVYDVDTLAPISIIED